MTSETPAFEPTVDYLALEEHILQQPPGTLLSWLQIEHDTGIVMDHNARQKLRRAMEKHRIEWHPLKGYGIEIANAESATGVVSRRLCRTRNAIVRTGRSCVNVLDKFRAEMHPGDRERVESTEAALAGALTYTNGAKKAFGPANDSRKKQIASETSARPPTLKGNWY